jgi:hypothetical protein
MVGLAWDEFGDRTPTIVSDIERKGQSDVEPVAITRAILFSEIFRGHWSLKRATFFQ